MRRTRLPSQAPRESPAGVFASQSTPRAEYSGIMGPPMKAAQVVARGKIQPIETPAPDRPAAGQVIVRTETGCLCGSDIPFFSEAQPSYPLAPALSLHEIIARVTESTSPMF